MPWDSNRRTHVPKRVRDAALQRDDNRCRTTLQTGGRCPETTNLEAHELEQWTPERRLELEDVVMLCPFHHNLITQQQARAARQATPTVKDTRPPTKHPGLR